MFKLFKEAASRAAKVTVPVAASAKAVELMNTTIQSNKEDKSNPVYMFIEVVNKPTTPCPR